MTQLEIEKQAIEKCGKLLIDEIFAYNDVECVVLSDAERCYIQGYKDATEKACEWLLEHTSCCSPELERFKKAMEE